jgi:hypothetical protein
MRGGHPGGVHRGFDGVGQRRRARPGRDRRAARVARKRRSEHVVLALERGQHELPHPPRVHEPVQADHRGARASTVGRGEGARHRPEGSPARPCHDGAVPTGIPRRCAGRCPSSCSSPSSSPPAWPRGTAPGRGRPAARTSPSRRAIRPPSGASAETRAPREPLRGTGPTARRRRARTRRCGTRPATRTPPGTPARRPPAGSAASSWPPWPSASRCRGRGCARRCAPWAARVRPARSGRAASARPAGTGSPRSSAASWGARAPTVLRAARAELDARLTQGAGRGIVTDAGPGARAGVLRRAGRLRRPRLRRALRFGHLLGR